MNARLTHFPPVFRLLGTPVFLVSFQEQQPAPAAQPLHYPLAQFLIAF